MGTTVTSDQQTAVAAMKRRYVTAAAALAGDVWVATGEHPPIDQLTDTAGSLLPMTPEWHDLGIARPDFLRSAADAGTTIRVRRSGAAFPQILSYDKPLRMLVRVAMTSDHGDVYFGVSIPRVRLTSVDEDLTHSTWRAMTGQEAAERYLFRAIYAGPGWQHELHRLGL